MRLLFPILSIAFASFAIPLLASHANSTLKDLSAELGVRYNQLLQEFKDSSFFDIYPKGLSVGNGTIIAVDLGIRNTAADGKAHHFVINALADRRNNLLPTRDIQSWVDFIKLQKIVPQGELTTDSVRISVPQDTPFGNYSFTILACSDISPAGKAINLSSEICLPGSPNVWGEPHGFLLSVKPKSELPREEPASTKGDGSALPFLAGGAGLLIAMAYLGLRMRRKSR